MKKHQEHLDWKLLFGAMIVVLCLSYVVAYQKVSYENGIFSTLMSGKYINKSSEMDNKPRLSSLSIGKTWNWVMTKDYDDNVVTPKNKDEFTLMFNSMTSFGGTTDCNTFMGSYIDDGYKMSFTNIASTKKFCEDSQETEFVNSLQNVKEYKFSKSNELIMVLKDNKGVMIFKLK